MDAAFGRTYTGRHCQLGCHNTRAGIGDATHTRWVWESGVESATYFEDIRLIATSLARLKKLVNSNLSVSVHPGHQALAL